MDGNVPRQPDAAPTERERRDRVLLQLISSSTPREFWVTIKSGITSAYRETHDANQNDPRILQSSHGFKTISDRHYYCDRVLYDASIEFRFTCQPEQIRINRWRYAQSAFGSFTSIQKYCHSPSDLPKPADFRRQLAQSGGISMQGDLLHPHAVRVDELMSYNGILIHGPLSRAFRSPDFREVGFICFAIPYDDYSGWGAIFPVDRLIAECQNQGMGIGQGNAASENLPAPKWKKRPDQEE